MPSGNHQSAGQKRLTNVAIVRLTRAGKRFEVACYCNKVVNWRNGVETDLTEVLQSEFVFTNVSKGEFAQSKAMKKAFGTDDQEEVCRRIIQEGELQVSDRERQVQYDSTFRDIATIVCAKCINPQNNRPYTISTIQNAMREIHFAVKPGQSAKQQALEVIRRLQEHMGLERAPMKIRIRAESESEAHALETALKRFQPTSESQRALAGGMRVEQEGQKQLGRWVVNMLIEPGAFREASQISKDICGGRNALEVVQLSVQEEGDADLEEESNRLKTLNVNDETGTRQQQQQPSVSATALPTKQSSDSSDLDLKLKDESAEERSDGLKGGGRTKGKSQRKSKGAKRREKEEAAERAQRRQAELERSQERARGKKAEQEKELQSGAVTATTTAATTRNKGGKGMMTCNTCRGEFDRSHFKSDWHRYNLKLKLEGVTPIGEEEFRLVDADGFFS